MVLPLVATITTPTLSLGQEPGPSLDGEDNIPLNEPQIEEPTNTRTGRNRRRKDKPLREPRTRTRDDRHRRNRDHRDAHSDANPHREPGIYHRRRGPLDAAGAPERRLDGTTSLSALP